MIYYHSSSLAYRGRNPHEILIITPNNNASPGPGTSFYTVIAKTLAKWIYEKLGSEISLSDLNQFNGGSALWTNDHE